MNWRILLSIHNDTDVYGEGAPDIARAASGACWHRGFAPIWLCGLPDERPSCERDACRRRGTRYELLHTKSDRGGQGHAEVSANGQAWRGGWTEWNW